jgi:EPS-associated MarR family transcriptional regulator
LQSEELNLSVLRNIEENKTQKSLADDIGVSVGKINYVLKALIEKGFVKAESFFASKNKNQYKYLLTEKGIKQKLALTEKYIQIKKAEYDALVKDYESMKGEGL